MQDFSVKVIQFSSLIFKSVGWLDNENTKLFYGRIDNKNVRVIASTAPDSDWCSIELKYYIDLEKSVEIILQDKWEQYLIPLVPKLEQYFNKEFSTLVFLSEKRTFRELPKEIFDWKTSTIISSLGAKCIAYSKEADSTKLSKITKSIAENLEEPDDCYDISDN